MNDFPYLIFDSNAELKIVHKLDIPEVRGAFIGSLYRGDKEILERFCAGEFDPASKDYKLFKLKNFVNYRFAFLEKNSFRGEIVNVVYFAENFNEFHQLISPSSHYYRSFTGQLIYELLLTSYEKTANTPYLTPSAFLALDKIPHLRDELLKNPRLPELCSLRTLIERMIENIKNSRKFGKLVIEASFTDSPSDIAEFSIPACIYLFTSLIYIFSALSVEHKIRIELTDGEIVFSVNVPKSREVNCEMGSLAELAEFVPSMENIAKVAAAVAYDANISTAIAYDSETQILRTSTLIGTALSTEPTFHFRDPYSDIPEIFEEFSQFMRILADSAA